MIARSIHWATVALVFTILAVNSTTLWGTTIAAILMTSALFALGSISLKALKQEQEE